LACHPASSAARASGGSPGRVNAYSQHSAATARALQATVTDSSTISLLFNVPVQKPAPQAFALQPALPITAIQQPQAHELQLQLQGGLVPGQNYVLQVPALQSCYGVPGTAQSVPVGRGRKARPHEVLITEVLPAPHQDSTLAYEFVEVLNTSTAWVHTGGLSLDNGLKQATLPHYTLAPGQRLVLCSSTAASQWPYASTNVRALSPWPTLYNRGDTLLLRLDSLPVARAVYGAVGDAYSPGVALELQSHTQPCHGQAWQASKHKNGHTAGHEPTTPQALPAPAPLAIQYAFWQDTAQLRVVFNQAVGPGYFEQARFTFNTAVPAYTIVPDATDWRACTLIFNEVLPSWLAPGNAQGQEQELAIKNVQLSTCSGHLSANVSDNVGVTLIMLGPAPGIILNELLVNPWPNGVEFVELLNSGSTAVNLKQYRLGVGGQWPGQTVALSNEDLLLYPGQVLAFSPQPQVLAGQYVGGPLAHLFAMPLPTLPNQAGVVYLGHVAPSPNAQDAAIFTLTDSVPYNETWHHPVLTSTKGVSLERISPLKASWKATNWASATALAGYATPGSRNSQQLNPEAASQQGALSTQPAVIVPGQSPGQCVIKWQGNGGQWLANGYIFNAKGMIVYTFCQQQALGNLAEWVWHGTNEQGNALPPGNYMAMLEMWNINGQQKRVGQNLAIGFGYE